MGVNATEIELAYGSTGPLGMVGGVYLHAASGDFARRPNAEESRMSLGDALKR